MCRYVEIFFRNYHWGPVSILGRQIWAAMALSGAKTVTMKLTKKAALNLTTLQGCRQWEASGFRPPISCLAPVCCIHPILYLKNVAPPCGFWFPLLRNPGDGPATLPLHITEYLTGLV